MFALRGVCSVAADVPGAPSERKRVSGCGRYDECSAEPTRLLRTAPWDMAGMMEMGSCPGLAVVLMDVLHTSLDIRFEVDFSGDR